MDMYAKCGALALVEQVFGSLVGNRDVVSWTTLVSAYADHGHGRRAVGCLEQMRRDGICPNAATYVCALKACASFCTGISTGIWAVEKVAEMHAEIGRDGLLEREPVLGNALIDAYVKLGSLSGAQAVFDKLRSRDVVSWTSLVAGYAEHGRGDEALQRLEQMKGDGVLPNAVTFACALKACCDTGAAEKGRELHGEIETKGWLLTDGVVGNALVDMYGRCGSLATAQQVFDELPSRDAAACNSLIAGYAQAGESEAALHVFESRMPREQIAPDSITFVVVLNACSRAGLSGRCETYFTSMARDFGIAPSLEHHAGLVDLLCRAGRLDDAVSLVRKMPFSPNLVVWNTVLGACRYSGNVELGRRAFECSLRKLHRT
jgi:pentatricopeptide repeat protein